MSSSRSSHSDPVTPGEQPTISVTDDYVVEMWRGAEESALYYRRNVTLDDLRATWLAFQALDRAIEDRHGPLGDALGREIRAIEQFMTNVSDIALELHEAHGQALGVPSSERNVDSNTFEQFRFGAWLHLTQRALHSALSLPPWRPTERFCLSGPLPVPSLWHSTAARHGCARPRDVEQLAELTRDLCQTSAHHFATQVGAQYEPDYESARIYENLFYAVERTLGNHRILHGRDNPELRDSRRVINHEDEYIAEEASIGCRLVLSAQQSMLNGPHASWSGRRPDSAPGPHSLACAHLQSQILWNAWDSFNNVVEEIKRVVREGEEDESGAALWRLGLLESEVTEE